MNVRVPKGRLRLPEAEHDANTHTDENNLVLFRPSCYGFADPDQYIDLLRNTVGYTALFFAAGNGNDFVVKALLATNNVDIKQVDIYGKNNNILLSSQLHFTL